MNHGFFHRHSVGVFAAVIAVAALSPLLAPRGAAVAAIPHSGPDAYTDKQYAADLYQWHRTYLIDKFEEYGHADPRWNEPAKRLLDFYSKLWTGSKVDSMYWFDVPGIKVAHNWGKQAIDAGCEDPFIIHCHGRTLLRMGRRKQAEPLLRRAWENMDKGDWPPVVRAKILYYLQWPLSDEEEAAMDLDRKIRQAWAEALLAKNRGKMIKRYIIANNDLDDMDADEIADYRQVAEEHDDPDPWAYHMILGCYHLRTGWAERGGGWAHTVTPEGWRGFAAHLKDARRHFFRAWQIDPDMPEAPTVMIEVVMGGADAGGESERIWFDRAVKAQFDHESAYGKLFWALRPRWGGSHEAMYRFAIECVQTDRFDTDIPFYLPKTLRDIREEQGHYGIFHRPATHDALDRLFKGALAEPGRRKDREHLLTYQAALAWRCQRYEVARAALDQVDRNPVRGPWRLADAAPRHAIMEIHVRTGPAAERFEVADQLFARGDHDGARQRYRIIRAEYPDAPHIRDYANHQIQRARWHLALADDGPVDLTPDPDLITGDRLPGYRMMHGTWRLVDETILEGKADKYGLTAIVDFRPGPNWRLTGTMDLTESRMYRYRDGGIYARYATRETHLSVHFYPEDDRVRILRDGGTRTKTSAEVPRVIPFRVDHGPDRLIAYLDGERVLTYQPRRRVNRPLPLALGDNGSQKGDTLRFENLRLLPASTESSPPPPIPTQ